MLVKESLVDVGMVQFQFQLKAALTVQLPSPPGCKTSIRGSRFQRAGSPIAVKVLTTVKVCFLLFRKMKIFQQWLALVHFAMLYSTHRQRLRRQYSNRFDGINSKEKK